MNQKVAILKQIILALFLASTTSLTSLTTTNCPKNYDLSAANTTADSSAKPLATLIYGGLYSPQDQATLSQSFTVGDTKTVNTYVVPLHIAAPFAVIGGGFCLVFVIALICCVCEKSCPPCKSWKRDYAARPYEKFELKCVTVFATIFAFAIAVSTAVGFAYFPALQQDIKMAKCSLFYSLDVALNGDGSVWGGFVQLTNQVGNISSQLTSTGTAINANLSNSEWISSDLNALRQMNVNIYTNNNISAVYSPNPTTTASAISANTPLPTVVPQFISSGLGPHTLNNTMTAIISGALEATTAKVSQQGYKVYKAAQLLQNSVNNIQANTNVNLQSLSMNSNYFDAVSVSLSNFSTNVFDSLFNWALYLVQAILAFVMMGSICIIIGVVATNCFELYACKTCVHLGWVTYGLTYFGILVISFFMFTLGGISYSFCQFYGGFINSPKDYASFASSSTPTSFTRIFEKLNVCFFSNGSITSSFMLEKEVATVSSLYGQITKYLAMTDNSKATYVDLTTSTTIITGWINAIQNYRQGRYIDASAGLTTEDNPSIALAGMNQFTIYGNGVVPICSNDLWVFDKINCTFTPNQTIYSSNTTNGSIYAASGFECISFNEYFSSNSSSIWMISDIAARYIPLRQCQGSTQAYESIMSYAQSLINYRDSRINLYQNLKDQLTSLLAKNVAYNSKIAGYTASVNAFTSATATLNTLVTNQINGVDYSSNCTAIADSLRLLYNIFCINFIYKLIQFGISCLFMLVLMVGGMLTGTVFGIRYGRIEKELKIVMPEMPVASEMHSETFEKRQQSSDSSSSDND